MQYMQCNQLPRICSADAAPHFTKQFTPRRSWVKLKHAIALLSVLLACLAAPATVSATVLFFDDFTRSNSDTAGALWDEKEAQVNDISIYNDRLRLRDYLTTGYTQASFELDTTGYQQLTLDIEWQALSSTEASDSLNVGLADQFSSALWSTGLGDSGTFSSTLDLNALNDSGQIELALWLDVNSHTETVYINRISISGSAIASDTSTPPAGVPEPSSFALLGLGVLSLIATRRRLRA